MDFTRPVLGLVVFSNQQSLASIWWVNVSDHVSGSAAGWDKPDQHLLELFDYWESNLIFLRTAVFKGNNISPTYFYGITPYQLIENVRRVLQVLIIKERVEGL
jgi:hypothetical protein